MIALLCIRWLKSQVFGIERLNMSTQDSVARIVQPSTLESGSKKVVYTDAFEKRKRERVQEAAMNRIMSRALKTDW